MDYALKDAIGYRINQCSNYINQQLNSALKVFDIGIEQRAALEIIKFEKEVNQTLLAHMLGKDKTTMSRTLNALEKKELLEKIPVKHDKRAKTLKLTPKGEQILEESLPIVQQYRKDLLSKVNPQELSQFFNTLNKLMN